MAQIQTSPSKRSSLQRLTEQNAQLRQQLSLSQSQKIQLQKQIKKYQNQVKVLETKYSVLQSQFDKQKAQNHRFIQAYESQKKQRLALINNQHSVLNNLNRDQVQLQKLKNQNNILRQQVENLQKNLQNQKTQRVTAIRQKQNSANKITLLETKLQAVTAEAKYSKISHQQLEGESKRLKQTITALEKQLKEKQGPIQVQTIYRDSSSTTQKLVKQFEQKMKQKQSEMIKQIQNYERKNSLLSLRVTQLQAQLLNLSR